VSKSLDLVNPLSLLKIDLNVVTKSLNLYCEGLAPIQGKNTVVGATETRIMESVRLSATVSHDIRTRLAFLASLGTFVTARAAIFSLSTLPKIYLSLSSK
jgi:hypothetical protein